MGQRLQLTTGAVPTWVTQNLGGLSYSTTNPYQATYQESGLYLAHEPGCYLQVGCFLLCCSQRLLLFSKSLCTLQDQSALLCNAEAKLQFGVSIVDQKYAHLGD